MTNKQIDTAIAEARRFLAIALIARVRMADEGVGITGSKETAAAKRASLDLTRALAEMRKP